jgi:hypothetical protein
MQALEKKVVGYVELEVGSLAVQVPVREADPTEPDYDTRLASFETDGQDCVIVVRGDTTTGAGEEALREAAQAAVRHLSRKLLN